MVAPAWPQAWRGPERRQAVLVGRRAHDRLRPRHRRVAERLAKADAELLGGDVGQRAAPLQPVGAVGCALDHLLELVPVEAEDVGVRAGRLL